MNRILLICMIIALCSALVFSGVSAVLSRQESLEASSDNRPTPMEIRLEEQMETMKTFLIEHPAEMEEIAAVIMEYSEPTRIYEYTVYDKTVRVYNGVSYWYQEKYTEHPIVSKASLLEEDTFLLVGANFTHSAVDNDICSFMMFVNDDEGDPRWRIYLFFCEEEPIAKYPFEISQVIPHWYFYFEDCP